MASALNAIIIASSFILTFIQFSETGENQRREAAKKKLQEAKKEFLSGRERKKFLSGNKLPSDDPEDEYEDLVSQLPMEYKAIRGGLFLVLILSFLFHIKLILHPASPPPDYLLVALVYGFVGILAVLYMLWFRGRRKTKKYIADCNQLRKTYESTYNVAEKLKAKLGGR